MRWWFAGLVGMGGIVLGGAVALVATQRALRRMRLEKYLLVEEAIEMVGGLVEGVLDVSERMVEPWSTPLPGASDEVIDCGIRVVTRDGRVVGTALMPAPTLN